MGLYGEQILPRVIDAACGLKGVLPFYPESVTRVDAIEPADVGWKLAGKRLRATSVPVKRSGLDGQSLPLADSSCDTALSTWTLCTIPDVATALADWQPSPAPANPNPAPG